MADVFEEQFPSHHNNTQTRNPTPKHREATPHTHGRIANAIRQTTPPQNKENGPAVIETRAPEDLGGKAAQIIQDLYLRVQELKGRVITKEGHHTENGSHATSRSRSCSETGRLRSPKRCHSKRHEHSISRDPEHWRNTDDDQCHRETKCTRSEHVIMGATPFTERILKAKLPKGFDKPRNMKYDGTRDPQEYLNSFRGQDEPGRGRRCGSMQGLSVTIAGPMTKWFNALPNGSITSFHDISRKFMAKFTTRITKAKHPIILLGVTQK
ncbi:hypothetical protein Ahy_A06g029017 [Arachis hypogaea]|uniref:Retrotransposon gag domain-containing protein n=1 Tax=Arachis hypogaea TaxID=3818 RepID=A0A445CS37_ARAHY|nr:hypothetical protein Ahy_A06g029017 [Arachis hypogaea]